MGQETRCQCRWGEEEGECKVLLEAGELILRGELRRKVALGAIAGLAIEGEELRFQVGGVEVALGLGREAAERWAKAMVKPPATLAKKLGITGTTQVGLIGEVDDAEEELKGALAEAEKVTRSVAGVVDLVVVLVEELAALDRALQVAAGEHPIWVVYPKGKGTQLGEGQVRELMRGRGYMDTKVASVSARLTALRFTRRAG